MMYPKDKDKPASPVDVNRLHTVTVMHYLPLSLWGALMNPDSSG